jgi:hypothetical protein
MHRNESTVKSMGEIRGVIAKESEAKFRQLAMKKFGYGKGSLSKALEEALNAWIRLHEEPNSE